MKAAVIPVLAALAGIAAANPSQGAGLFKREANCNPDIGDAPSAENCADNIKFVMESKGEDIPLQRSYGFGCMNGCQIKAESDNPEGTTVKGDDIIVALNSIVKGCAGDGKTPFQGSAHSGQKGSGFTVKVGKGPETC